MWAYWLLFLLPVGMILSPFKIDRNINYLVWAIFGLLAVLLIGLRYEIGVDWPGYLTYLNEARIRQDDIAAVMLVGNANGLAYMLLNWTVIKLGLGIYVVNLVSAAILIIGLMKYCQKQPIPWLALAVAMPYTIGVVAMAYTRQAVALGFLFWGLAILREGKEGKYFSLVMLGTLFHMSAIVNLPYMVLARKRILWYYYLFFGLFIGGVLVLLNSLGYLSMYIRVVLYTLELHSAGAAVRAYMNVVPVLASLFFLQRIKRISPDWKIIKWMALAAFASIALLSVSSTMVDRFALYLIPLQVALWPRLVSVQQTMLMRSILASMILSYYCLVLYVWFHYAAHAPWFLPYSMWPFHSEPLFVPQLLPM